jgi:uncharacterized Zn finger protein (UPF0148 family)
MTRTTCPECGAEHCPVLADGRTWCPECERRKAEARARARRCVSLAASVAAIGFSFRAQMARVLEE